MSYLDVIYTPPSLKNIIIYNVTKYYHPDDDDDIQYKIYNITTLDDHRILRCVTKIKIH